jgi:hypothetical protein
MLLQLQAGQQNSSIAQLGVRVILLQVVELGQDNQRLKDAAEKASCCMRMVLGVAQSATSCSTSCFDTTR